MLLYGMTAGIHLAQVRIIGPAEDLPVERFGHLNCLHSRDPPIRLPANAMADSLGSGIAWAHILFDSGPEFPPLSSLDLVNGGQIQSLTADLG